jgi:hypothetical protein
MPRRPSSDLTRLDKVISSSLETGFLGLAEKLVKIFDVWLDAVGTYVAERTRPESIRDGVLTVLVESSVWIDRLNYLKTEFIESINTTLGEPMVSGIVFKVGPVSSPRQKARSEVDRLETKPKRRNPDNPKIEAAVSGIKDPDLKRSLASLLAWQDPSPEE